MRDLGVGACADRDYPVFLGQDNDKPMSTVQPKNPLHGLTLEMILSELLEQYGWEGLSQLININCFKNDPSLKSSLKFLRKTAWAREKVESLYLESAQKRAARD